MTVCVNATPSKGTTGGSASAGHTPSEDGRRRQRKEKLDKVSRIVHDAAKRGLHGKVIVTFRDGTPQNVEVAETYRL